MKVNLIRLFIYRTNFIGSLISSLGWGISSIISMLLLTSKINSAYGWSREELLILTGLYGIFIGLFHVIFSRNFSNLSRIINKAELDSYLLKPLDVQFSLSLWTVYYIGIFRVLLAAGFTAYIIYSSHIQIELINIISFFLVLPLSLLLLYSVWFIISTLLIWFPLLSNLTELLFHINDITRFPPEMYKRLSNVIVFMIIPLTFVVVTPLKVLLNKIIFGDIAGLFIFSLSLFFISRIFWKFALRYYTSASS